MSSPMKISVGMSSCNLAAGSKVLFETLEASGLDAELGIMGCQGMCHAEPLVRIEEESGEYLYLAVNPAKLQKIIAEHIPGRNAGGCVAVQRQRRCRRGADGQAAADCAAELRKD